MGTTQSNKTSCNIYNKTDSIETEFCDCLVFIYTKL